MILILTQCFPSRIGGIESLISNLAVGLSKNENTIVFADRHNFYHDNIFDQKHKESFLVRRTGGIKFFRRRKKIKEMKLLIMSKQVKLVIADSWKSLELAIDFLNSNDIPVFCLAHGNELLSKKIKKLKTIKDIYNKSTKVIANSLYTKDLIKKIISPSTTVEFIYPGAFDLRNLNATKMSISTGYPVILTLARLEKRKGHSFVIESVKKLLPDFPQIQYIIAGKGPEEQNLKKIVEKNKLKNNIVFVGEVNDLQKKYLFENTNLMVMPTLDDIDNRSIEGFGIAYLEAAFFEIPSIASNIGGTTEAVLHNETGIIINRIDELESVLRDLLNNKEKIIQLGVRAKKRALKEFQWNNVIKKYLSLTSSLKINLK